MQKLRLRNETIFTEFILLGFGELQEMHILLFVVFLVIYLMTMTGNLLILVLVVADENLHTPMYFFLGNLSCLETCYSSTILPRMLASFLTENQSVPVASCVLQFWDFGFLAATECYLLAAMSYDCYVAICRPIGVKFVGAAGHQPSPEIFRKVLSLPRGKLVPATLAKPQPPPPRNWNVYTLHYSALMNVKICLQLVAGSWIISFVANTILLMFILQLTFCGNNVTEHFFCDFTLMMKLTCNDSHQVELLSATLSALCTLPPFVLTITSYVYIISAILGIPSTTDRQKAFSTCSSHLAVVTIFYGTLIIVYLLPDTKELRQLNKILSVFYTILTPLINPLIYSLRNKEVKEALKRTTRKCKNYIRLRVH